MAPMGHLGGCLCVETNDSIGTVESHETNGSIGTVESHSCRLPSSFSASLL